MIKGGRTTKARRSHSKSRTGCTQCKQRKVKCDEQKPICQRCDGYGTPCSFLQTHPVRGPPIKRSLPIGEPDTPLPPPIELLQPLPVHFTILDLELLYSWVTTTAAEFGGFEACTQVYQTTVVKLAFEYEFLMYEVLSLSALHLSSLRPEKSSLYHYASNNHAAMGISLSRKHLLNLNSTNCHACLAFSTITFVHAWASQDRSKPSTLFFTPSSHHGDEETIEWVKLHRGSHEIIKTLFHVIEKGPFEPLFAPWKGLDRNEPYGLLDEDKEKLDDLAEAWNSPSVSEAHKAVLSNTLRGMRRIFSMITYPTGVTKIASVTAWFSFVDEAFLEMMTNKVPEALLFAAVYSVALKRVHDDAYRWWLDGMAENLLGTVILEIGKGWERWTSWPIDQVMGGKGVQQFSGNIPTPY